MEKRAKPLLDMLREVLHCTALYYAFTFTCTCCADRYEYLLYIANYSTFHVTERRKSGQVADYCCPTCVGRGIYYRT
jgi:hypothetical protein